MRRTLLLSLLVVGAAAALAIGSYSALADAGPVTSVANAVIGDDGPDDANVVDDVNGDDVDAQDSDDGDAEGAEDIAQVIAETFGADQQDVLALYDQGIGFGALFHLYTLAAATDGTSVDDLLAAADTNGDGEYEFAFGKLFKMAGGVSALSAGEDGIPRNLGQAVSDVKSGDEGTALAAHTPNGNGPPDHAPAHGRN